MYIFTDEMGKVVEIKDCPGSGIEAASHRDELKKKHKKTIISWSHMGSGNPGLLIDGYKKI